MNVTRAASKASISASGALTINRTFAATRCRYSTLLLLSPRAGGSPQPPSPRHFSAKRAIKQNDTLWAAVQTWRRVRARN
jgi:hypothetical protein